MSTFALNVEYDIPNIFVGYNYEILCSFTFIVIFYFLNTHYNILEYGY